jgi:AbrB family looped-hinge helix DNA binding protein
MPLAKVLPRGQITIPQEVREAVQLQPGDTVQLRVTGPDTFQITVLPRRSLDEWISRYRVTGPVDADQAINEGEEDEARQIVVGIERDRHESTEESA